MGAFIAHSFNSDKHRLHSLGQQEPSPVYGRQITLETLDRAVVDAKTQLVLLQAPIAQGKTASLRYWLYHSREINANHLDAVFGWSFPNPLVPTQIYQNVTIFLDYLLAWLNIKNDREQPQRKKLALLIDALRQQRILLLLDHFPKLSTKQANDYKEREAFSHLYKLINVLAVCNPGLCIVCTDENLAIAPEGQAQTQWIFLNTLALADGLRLLQTYLPQTSLQQERLIKQLSQDPLSLILLGNYLRYFCNNDLGQIDQIPVFFDPNEAGRHTRRFLSAFEYQLQKTPELAMLYVLSLFTELPSKQQLINLISQKFRRKLWFFQHWLPKKLTPLTQLNSSKIQLTLDKLVKMELISIGNDADIIEMHPCVHHFFQQSIRSKCFHELEQIQGFIRESENMPAIMPRTFHVANKPNPYQLDNSQKIIENQIKYAVAHKDWQQASILSKQLCDFHFAKKKYDPALLYAKQSVTYAELTQDLAHLKESLNLLLKVFKQTHDEKGVLSVQHKWQQAKKRYRKQLTEVVATA